MRYIFKSKVTLLTTLTLTLGVSHSLMCDLLDCDQVNHSHSINQPAFMGADPEYTEDKLPLFKTQEATLSPEVTPSENAIVKTATEEPVVSKIEEPIEEANLDTPEQPQEAVPSAEADVIVKISSEEPTVSKIEEPIEAADLDPSSAVDVSPEEPT